MSPSDVARCNWFIAAARSLITFPAATAARSASANPASNVTDCLHSRQFLVSISRTEQLLAFSELHSRQGRDIFDGAVEIAHHDNLLGVPGLQILDVVGRQGLDLLGGLLDCPECVA